MAERPKTTVLFIINPISGTRRRSNVRHTVNRYLDKNKFEYKFKYTAYSGHAEKLSREAVQNKTDIIVAVGGDGTINEVASQMIGSDSVLGIIPLGSGNGLARHLGIPRIIPRAIRQINKYNVTSIDTATLNGVPFVSIAGVGFDAKVARLFSKSQKRGFFTYAHLITNNFIKYKPKKYELRFEDGKVIRTQALFISFANSNQFGYNTAIAPNALLKDGQLDICIVEKPNFFELPIIANLLLLRAIDKSQYVKTIRASKFEIRQKRNRWINIDGEARKLSKKIEVVVAPQSLKVIIPDHEIK
ncbi:MAG: diacylglycerol kinase family lipid kinase [Bacteroidales bacterium]|nr:diacylglycerol kinase family lipid kinase [Bacteroidales bacterium]